MKRNIAFTTLFLCCMFFIACEGQKKGKAGNEVRAVELKAPKGKAIAAFAEGCFWCGEHIFESVIGVDSAVAGYAGGHVPNPTYEQVCTETTGHAETFLVYYDPVQVSYEELTKVFFTSHDPTTLDRQGPDRGSSYRSVIFYSTPEEKAIAEKALKTFSLSFPNPIVTEITPLTAFYRAEQYHQDYIRYNPESPYVQGVSLPRFEQFKKTYKGKLRE